MAKVSELTKNKNTAKVKNVLLFIAVVAGAHYLGMMNAQQDSNSQHIKEIEIVLADHARRLDALEAKLAAEKDDEDENEQEDE